MAIQLAKAFGANAYATAGTTEKCAFWEQLGAVRCVNYKQEDFEQALAGVGINVVLDMVGSSYTPKNLRLLTTDGRLMFINAMQGANYNGVVNPWAMSDLTWSISASNLPSSESRSICLSHVDSSVIR